MYAAQAEPDCPGTVGQVDHDTERLMQTEDAGQGSMREIRIAEMVGSQPGLPRLTMNLLSGGRHGRGQIELPPCARTLSMHILLRAI